MIASNFGEKLDKILSAIRNLLFEHYKRKYTGGIIFTVHMHMGVPVAVKTILEVKRQLCP